MIGLTTKLPLREPIRLAFALSAALGALVCPPGAPASAQSRDMQQIIDRMDRLERELGTVQRQAFGGKPPAGGPAAPGASAAPVPGDPVARMEVRLNELEGILATITGRLEELTFQNQSLQNRLDKLVTDVDFRLRSLEGGAPRPPGGQAGGQTGALPPGLPAGAPPGPPQGQLGAAPAPGASQTAGGRTALTLPGTPQDQPVGVPPPSHQPGVLGTLTQADLAAAQRQSPAGGQAQAAPPQAAPTQTAPPQTAAAVALPPGSAKDQYEFAYNLLRQRNYADAESAFKQFVERHKKDELSGNAYYWLGETHYVRKQFEPAAIAFLEGYKGFPKGSKAADNLLKLGMSLAALNRQGEACTTFARLNKEFPDAPSNLKAVTDNERKKLSCPG